MAIFLLNNTDYVVAAKSSEALCWWEQNSGIIDVTCDVVKEDFIITDWLSGVKIWASEYIQLADLPLPFLVATVASTS